MKKEIITVSLAICAFFSARAEEAGAVEPDKVYYLGVGSASVPTAANMREGTAEAIKGWYLTKPSPMGVSEAWSDGETPHYGPVYVAAKTNGCGVLWTPFQESSTVYDMFKTLVLTGGIKLFLFQASGKTATFNDLRVDGSAEIQLSNNGGSTILDGMITVEDDATLTFRSFNTRSFNVSSEIRGSGGLVFTAESTTSAADAPHLMYGQNTNFYGKIEVKGSSKRTDTSHTTLSITNEVALGGVLDEFTYDALYLNRLGQLTYSGTSNLVLSISSNRGLSVGIDNGLISVGNPAGVLTLNWPITLGKTILQKIGEGRLVLGSALRFTSRTEATSDDPNDSNENPTNIGSHRFDVRAGSLSVTHCDALNGAKIAFSNNTEMVMSIDLPEGDMKRYGMKCTKIAEPFATDVPIKLVESEKGSLTESKYAVALTTVKAEYAGEAQEKISVELVDVNNYKLLGVRTVANEKVSEEDEETVTLYADILHNGLVISVR